MDNARVGVEGFPIFWRGFAIAMLGAFIGSRFADVSPDSQNLGCLIGVVIGVMVELKYRNIKPGYILGIGAVVAIVNIGGYFAVEESYHAYSAPIGCIISMLGLMLVLERPNLTRADDVYASEEITAPSKKREV